MTDFVYLFRGGDTVPSAAQRDAQMQKWVAWIRDLEAKGHLEDRGNALGAMGDLDHATTLSTGCPILVTGGSVEVRPILNVPM
jgi:hypothetical protein